MAGKWRCHLKDNSHPEFDWDSRREPQKAFAGKQEGMAVVLAHSEEALKMNIYRIVASQPKEIPVPFIFETLRLYLEAHAGFAHTPKFWGAICNALLAGGWIVRDGGRDYMQTRQSHGRDSATYAWPDPWVVLVRKKRVNRRKKKE
jgi:hypothetical protein